jgi:hypothetical protein
MSRQSVSFRLQLLGLLYSVLIAGSRDGTVAATKHPTEHHRRIAAASSEAGQHMPVRHKAKALVAVMVSGVLPFETSGFQELPTAKWCLLSCFATLQYHQSDPLFSLQTGFGEKYTERRQHSRETWFPATQQELDR